MERGVAAALVALACLVWGSEAALGFAPFLTAFDHCAGIGCDFATFYRPQGEALARDAIVAGWTSPPLLAMVFALPWSLAAWTAVNVAAAAALAVVCAAEAGPVGLAMVALSMPVAHAVKWGQPSILLALLGVVAARLPGVRGALLGLGGALKVYPLGWALDAVVRRDVRTLVTMAGAAVVAGALVPALVIGPVGTAAFWGNVVRFQTTGASQAIASAVTLGGQGLPVALARIGAPPWLGWAAPILAIPAMRRAAPVPAAALAMTTVTLAIQPGWHHYFAFLPWVQAVAWSRGERAFTLASVALSAFVLVLLPLGPDVYAAFTTAQGTTIAAALAAIGVARVARQPS